MPFGKLLGNKGTIEPENFLAKICVVTHLQSRAAKALFLFFWWYNRTGTKLPGKSVPQSPRGYPPGCTSSWFSLEGCKLLALLLRNAAGFAPPGAAFCFPALAGQLFQV
jgi:hypothetical protein